MGGSPLGTSSSVWLRHMKRKKRRKTPPQSSPLRSHTFSSSSQSLCRRYKISVSFLAALDTGSVDINELRHRAAQWFGWVTVGLLLRASKCLCGPVCSLFHPPGTSFIFPTEWKRKHVSLIFHLSYVSQAASFPSASLPSCC